MKKLMSVLALFVAVAAMSFTTSQVAGTTESGSVKVRAGRNTARLQDGSTLIFVVRGEEIKDVQLRQPTGLVIKFEDDNCPTCGPQAPQPCTREMRCHYSEKYQATICFCVPKLGLSSWS